MFHLPAASSSAMRRFSRFTVERAVEITAGRAADLGTVPLVPLATLVGRVVDRAGAGIGAQPAAVVLRCAGREVARAATDEHAAFRFEGAHSPVGGAVVFAVPGSGDASGRCRPDRCRRRSAGA